MATAKQTGGLYYINGKAVNSEGVAVPNAPALGPDTVILADARPKTLAQEVAEVIAGTAKPVAAIAGDVVPLEDRIAEGIARGFAAAEAARLAAENAANKPADDKKADPKDKK